MKLNSEAKTKRNVKHTNELKGLRKVIAVATSNAEGIIFARHIFRMCGYDKHSVTMNPETQEINIQATVYNEARRNIWLELRNLIPVKARKKIEYEQTKFLEVEDD